MKVNSLSPEFRSLILASLSSGTFHVPGQNSASPKVSDDFFQAFAGKTVDAEILSIDRISVQGVNNASGIPTGKNKFTALTEIRCGEKTATIRLQVADLAAADGNKLRLEFNVFKSDSGTNAGKSYLWAQSPNRVTDTEKLKTFVTSLEVATPDIKPA